MKRPDESALPPAPEEVQAHDATEIIEDEVLGFDYSELGVLPKIGYADLTWIDQLDAEKDDDDPEIVEALRIVRQMKRDLRSLRKRTDGIRDLLAEQVGGGVEPMALLAMKMEVLIDAIVPEGTAQRLLFELQVEYARATIYAQAEQEIEAKLAEVGMTREQVYARRKQREAEQRAMEGGLAIAKADAPQPQGQRGLVLPGK